MGPPTGLRLRDLKSAASLRAIAGLSVVGASIGLALGQTLGAWELGWFEGNAVPRAVRIGLLVATAIGAVVAVAAGVAVLHRWGPKALGLTARFSAPFALAGLLPALTRVEAWPTTLNLAIALGVAVVAARALFRLHFASLEAGALAGPRQRLRAWKLPPRTAPAIVVVSAVACAAYMAFYAVRLHHRLQTCTWDLAQFDSEFFNTLHGHPFRCPAMIRAGDWSSLAGHAHFAIWLLVPFYALYPAAETLLVLQAVVVCAGAIPLYRFAARRLPQAPAVILALAYLLYPPMHGALFFDIHFQPFAAGFLLFAIDALDAKRTRWAVPFFAAALLCREDVSIGTAAIGLFLLLFTKRAKAGAILLTVSATYFVVMRFVLMPLAGPWGFAGLYGGLVPPGEAGFGAVIITLVTNPAYAFKTLLTGDKLRYALQILVPVAFLPIVRGRLWLGLLVGTLVTVLTIGAPALTDIGFQYGATFAPYIFVATALALAAAGRFPGRLFPPDVRRVERRSAVGALVVGTLLTTTLWGAVPPRDAFHGAYGRTLSFRPPTDDERARFADVRRLAAMVPPEAILAASDSELPQVSNRLFAWNLSTGYDGCDYILYNVRAPAAAEAEEVRKARAAGFTTVEATPHVELLKRPGAP